jgi:hypothetical protein
MREILDRNKAVSLTFLSFTTVSLDQCWPRIKRREPDSTGISLVDQKLSLKQTAPQLCGTTRPASWPRTRQKVRRRRPADCQAPLTETSGCMCSLSKKSGNVRSPVVKDKKVRERLLYFYLKSPAFINNLQRILTIYITSQHIVL